MSDLKLREGIDYEPILRELPRPNDLPMAMRMDLNAIVRDHQRLTDPCWKAVRAQEQLHQAQLQVMLETMTLRQWLGRRLAWTAKRLMR